MDAPKPWLRHYPASVPPSVGPFPDINAYGSLADAASLWQLQRGFEPEMNAKTREKLLGGWADAVSRTLGRTIF